MSSSPPPPPDSEPLYRQDEFERVPSAWTRPMQTAVAIYLVASPLLSLGSTLLFRADIARVAEAAMRRSSSQGRGTLTDAQIHDFANLSFGIGLGIGVFLLLAFAILAAFTYTRPRSFVFWVDFVLLALGAIGVISGLAGMVVRSGQSMPIASSVASVLSGLVSAGLVAWMLVGLLKFGAPWAQAKVPVRL